MTRDDQLIAITLKCVAANPDLRAEMWDRAEKDGRPVRLADVLLAVTKVVKYYGEDFFILADGTMGTPGGAEYDLELKNAISFGVTSGKELASMPYEKCQWNLRADDLDQQSDETISFIYELIK